MSTLLSGCGGGNKQTTSATSAGSAQPASGAQPSSDVQPTLPVANRALLIDLDGATYSAVQSGIAAGTLPNLATLQIQLAYSGGVVGTTSQQPNLDMPGWASLLTGTWAVRNAVTSDAPNQMLQSSSVFAMTKAVSAGLNGAVVESGQLDQLLTPEQSAGYLDTLTNCSQHGGDACVTQQALQMIDSGYATVVAQYHSAEDAALNYGRSSSNYMSTLTQLDTAVGRLLAETAKYPHWLVMVTASHGLNPAGGADGLPELPEATTFIGLNQPANNGTQGVNAAVPSALSGLYAYASIADVTPTLLAYRSALPAPANYAMDGGELVGAQPVSQLTGVTGSDNQSIVLRWAAPASGAITVLRDAQVIANLPAGATTYTDSQLGLTNAGSYQFNYTVAAGTASASDLATITYVPPPPPPPPLATTLTQGLVTYYPSSSYGSTLPTFASPALDAIVTGTTADSTLGPWASGYQSGSLTPDPFGGQGLLINTAVANPAGDDGYKLVQTNDVTKGAQFTIGFWFKTPGITTGDVPIFSNKNYVSGGNAGIAFGLFAAGIAFNIGSGSGVRADGPSSPYTPYTANQWMYLAISVDTVAKTMTWHRFDPVLGEATGTVATGSVNLANLVGLGQFGVGEDGTGMYEVNKCGDAVNPYTPGTCTNGSASPTYQQSFSEIAMWNRVLSETELQSIFASKKPLSTLLSSTP
ncbi:hypothetical protein PQQ52_33455 [Paraburkholderia sediminicola]|uniref:hypothetical protein n=1 Tax=Paraburkholderia sediminicola TaxID=458836 RepID=UPI0038B816A4